jgi:hypothetical protein
MDRKTLAGIGVAGTLVFGGVDASVLDEKPLQRIDYIATEKVEVKQIDNVVETRFPWKDQEGIKVEYDLGSPTITERFNDKRNREVITETVDFGDGGFKVDILLNEKPDTNIFCYNIKGVENYDFFYQASLTPEEIAQGSYRPPEIEGSYAVYHKSLKNHKIGQENYATGKVMHIPRPQVWELNNEEATKQWADLSFNEKTQQLCVTVDQKYLDNANYPVRVDPTFGYVTVGGTQTSVGGIKKYSNIATTTNSGTIQSITQYTYINSGTAAIGSAIYGTTAGSPSTLLSTQTSTTTINTTQQWVTTPISYTFASGEKIWLASWRTNTAGAEVLFSDSLTGASHTLTSGTAFAWDSPVSGTSVENIIYSMYARYTTTDPGTYTDYYTVIGDSTWTAPTGVTSVIAACWGGGGGGGDGSNTGGGGGGGGAFASSTITVTPGDSYTVTVGAGGAKPAVAAAAGGAGGDSSFWSNKVIADGGNGGAGGTGAPSGGSGGSLANSSGTVEYAGGAGGAADNTSDGGGGGGGAGGPHGTGGTGGTASITIGGAGGAGDNGSGGAAGTADSNGSADPIGGTGGSSVLGGGGGGGADDGDPGGNGGTPGGGAGGGEINSTAGTWGTGAPGQCRLTYTIPDPGGGGSATSTPQTEFWF